MDTQKITEAIMSTGVSPLAMESAGECAEYWIEQKVCADKKIVAVECGFVFWLDPDTAVIGVQDLLTDEDGTVGNEWKTTSGTTKFWNESKWFDSISEGSQLAIYALALQNGTYYEKSGRVFNPQVAKPRIRVRAVTKSNPKEIWPTSGDGIVTFEPKQLENTRNALLNKAASIRAMRSTKKAPWQLPGIWCENKFRKRCEYYNDCTEGVWPEGYGTFQKSDPAFQLALPHVKKNSNLVVLGASMYSTVSECPEKYRRYTLGPSTEDSMALDTGTAFHQGVACWYQEIQKEQQETLDNQVIKL